MRKEPLDTCWIRWTGVGCWSKQRRPGTPPPSFPRSDERAYINVHHSVAKHRVLKQEASNQFMHRGKLATLWTGLSKQVLALRFHYF